MNGKNIEEKYQTFYCQSCGTTFLAESDNVYKSIRKRYHKDKLLSTSTHLEAYCRECGCLCSFMTNYEEARE